MRRLSAAIAAAVLVLFGSVALAGAATADPVEVTITAPGEGGEDTTPLVKGTSNVSPVHLSLNGQEVATLTTDPGGNWSYQVVDALTRGDSMIIDAQVLDDAGDVRAQAELIYTPWLEKQTLTIVSPSAGDVLGTQFSVLSDAAPDPYLDVQLLVDGVENGYFNGAGEDGHLDNRVEDLAGGPHTLQVRATDRYDRVIQSDPITITVDATPPSKPTIVLPGPGTVIRTTSVTYRGTGEPGTELKLATAGAGERLGVATPDAQGRWTVTVDYSWAKGKHFEGYGVVARSRDDHDNVIYSDTLTLSLDLRTPAPATTTPSPTTTPTTTPSKPAGSAIPAATPAASPAPDQAPQLANTGSSTVSGTATAVLLIALGLGLSAASRRVVPVRR